MLLFKQLQRCLSKIVPLIFHRLTHISFLNLRDVKVSRLINLVGYLRESIKALYGLLVSLLVPKNKVNPLIEILGHKGRLKRLSHRRDVLAGLVVGPLGQLHVIHLNFVFFGAKVDQISILKELWHAEELRNQLSDVGEVVQ